MKSTYRPIFALLMILSLVLSACGGAPASIETAPAAATAVPAEAAPADAAAEPAADTTAAPAEEAAAEKPIWGWTTPAEYTAATGNTLPDYKESPMLTTRVDAGELPPVAERLPVEPVVDNPFNEVGAYGGNMTLGQVSASTGYPASNFTTFESMFLLDRYGAEVVPNIAKGWEFSNEGKTFTINLREGLKWSDGEPFTAEDIRYFWEDVMLNTDLTPNPPSRFSPGGEPMTMTVVDTYTVQLDFAVPYYAILPNLSSVVFTGCQGDFFDAAHYMKQFHIKYNPDVEADAKAAGFETWTQFYESKDYEWWGVTPDAPTMGPWQIVKTVPEGTVLERNPFYYKVDTEGNQLPYIDNVTATIFNDAGTLALKMVAGEYDYQDWSTTMADYPAFVAGKDQAGYELFLAPSLWTSIAAYSVNQNYTGDTADADILRDVRFRQALSISMDRDELNEIVGLGEAQVFQATVYPTAPYFKEEWGTAFTEFDPEGAGALLDEMGMDQRDGEGFRLRPDGQPFSLIVSDVNDAVPEKMAELLKEYWDAAGIRTIIRATDRTLMSEQFDSGDFMIAGWAMDGASDIAVSIGTNSYLRGWQWAPQWNAWLNSKGASGEEPPADVKKMLELYDQVPFMEPTARNEALTEIFDIWMDGLWRVGTIGMVPKPGIYKSDLGNVDTETFTDNADVGIGTFNRHYQFYWKAPQQ